ncbi:ABC transporter permease [Sphingomonas aracearum]|uniref:ABC transporter permease n=1 Tax=Sphingomonas aracearum TaxID=2283317 RepID=A0A369VVH5_9SPHN|nr:ABC transporter permease [Sphingomonas aracearum]RDE06396.1 ABC transporter permease [Sphingomonas aracearum]
MSQAPAPSDAPSNARRLLRQTLTIARRDFVATVFTPTFLLFLFAPLIMLSFGAVGGLGAQSVAQGADEKERIVALAPPASIAALRATDERLRSIFPRDEQPPQLLVRPAPPAPALHARALFDTRETDTAAVLYGPFERPQILYGPMGARASRYLAALAEATLRTERSGGPAALSRPTLSPVARTTTSLGGRNASAFFSVFGIFFLTLLLAGQAVGTMAEERSNKVIEVLAAAVPLESVFLGKLLGMFGVAVLFVLFWGTLVSQVGSLAPAGLGAALSQLSPAIGLPTFVTLFFAYFTMSYMLLGAVFLGVGAQASTMREIQMLSLPITIVQVAMFGWAAAGAGQPDSWTAIAAQVFPLSSPYAMAARAAQSPVLWPHLAALAWQALWVAIVITVAARAFRRGVLQSGTAKFRWPWQKAL